MSETIKHSAKWILLLIGIGGAGLASLIFIRRSRQMKAREREIKLRQKLDRQVCFGRPGSVTVVVDSAEDWRKVEGRFLKKVDATRMIGLDCEWLSDGKTIGKVALLQLGLTDGLCILVRTCKMNGIPESLRDVLRRYDVVKLGVAVNEDGLKLFNDFGVVVNGAVDLRFLVQRYCPGIVLIILLSVI
jgi:hypothetical protein